MADMNWGVMNWGAVPLARFLGDIDMAPSTYYEHVKKGRLPAPFRLGRRSYIDPVATREAIAAMRKRGPQAADRAAD